LLTIKLHTLLDLRWANPAFIHISDGKLHDATYYRDGLVLENTRNRTMMTNRAMTLASTIELTPCT
jgi:hypothetical protein